MDLLQLQCGSGTNFWELPYNIYVPLAPDGCIKFTWEATSSTPITVKGRNLTVSPAHRGDTHIIDALVKSGCHGTDLLEMNDCRIHLGVTLLSDMVTADGTMILPTMYK